MPIKTLRTIVGNLGHMLVPSPESASIGMLVDSPLADVRIDVTQESRRAFAGTIVVDQSPLENRPFLDGVSLRGTIGDPGRGDFHAWGLLDAESMPEVPGTGIDVDAILGGAVVFSGMDRTTAMSAHRSFADLVWIVGIHHVRRVVHQPLWGGTAILFDYDSSYHPPDAAWPHAARATAGQRDGEEDTADFAELLARLGVSGIDWSSRFPSFVPFLQRARLLRSEAYTTGTGKKGREARAITVGYLDDDRLPFGLTEAAVTLAISADGSAAGTRLGIEARGSIAGVPVLVEASEPQWRVRAMTELEEPVALADIARACGASAPDALKNLELDFALLECDLAGAGRTGASSLADADYRVRIGFSGNEPEPSLALDAARDGITVRLRGLTLEAGRTGSATDLALRAEAAFFSTAAREAEPDGGSAESGGYLFGFGVSGSFASVADNTISMTLKGALLVPDTGDEPVEPPSFTSVYEALTGRALPPACPTISITRLALTARYDNAFFVDSFEGAVRVAIDDAASFPIPVAFEAGIAYRSGSKATTLTGSFALAQRFSIRAVITMLEAETSYRFELMLGTTAISLSCAHDLLSASIAADFTLADAADALLRLFKWNDSFNRTGAWSFLNAVNLKGAALTYAFSTRTLRVEATPACTVSFVEMDSFAIVADPFGVHFEIVGSFDGADYPASKPLSFAPNEPPSPTGNALAVRYLALADGIAVDGMATTSVDEALAAIEAVINPQAPPSQLSVATDAGVLLACDFTAAQAVRVKLAYYGRTAFVAARFELFGDKAGVLAGLAAEFAYVKLTDNLGVFSGTFAPPAALRTIRMGGMTFGVGSIAASIYTNGDFEIDLGFPAKADFSRSFSFSYGSFSGTGGAYVKLHSTGSPRGVPATTLGRFSPVLQMGVGMRLALAQEFKAGLLSAGAAFTMQGIFEGVYATFLPYDAGADSEGYYRLDAAVKLEGRIHGSVNFGLVGAAVTVQAEATTRLTLEAHRAANVGVSAHVSAQAQIKILFARIKFGFSLNVSLSFALGEGSPAPWNASAEPSFVAAFAHHPFHQLTPPSHLSLAPVRDEGAHTMHVRVVMLTTTCLGRSALALFASISRSDFGILVDALRAIMRANGYQGETLDLELFNNARFFLDPADLDAFLTQNFVFEYEFGTEAAASTAGVGDARSSELAEDDVLMPLPDCFKLDVATRYASGSCDHARRDLSSEFMVDDAFIEAMHDYYDLTCEDEAPARARRARELAELARQGRMANGAKESLAMHQFRDYFDLLVKCVRAEQESRRLIAGASSADADAELDDVAGAASHFLLGGHRVIEQEAASAADGSVQLRGNLEAAGEQVFLPTKGDIESYAVTLELAAEHPDYVRFKDGAPSVRHAVSYETMLASLPAKRFSDDARYLEKPAVRPFFETVPAPPFSLAATRAVDDGSLFDAGEQMRPGHCYAFPSAESSGRVRYVGITAVSLIKCSDDPLLFAIAGMTRTKHIASWKTHVTEIDGIALTALHPDGALAATCQADGCYLLAGRGGDRELPLVASGANRDDWLSLLLAASRSESTFYLGFYEPGACPFAPDKEVELTVLVSRSASKPYLKGFDALQAAPCTADRIVVQPQDSIVQNVVEQGSVVVSALTSDANLPADEALLSDAYANMALKLRGDGQRETPPFVSRTTSDAADDPPGETRRTTAMLPYARSLGSIDRYAAVREGADLSIEPLWIDVAGNTLAEQEAFVSFTPRYVDDVIGFGAYANVRTWFCIEEGASGYELKVEAAYEPPESGLEGDAGDELSTEPPLGDAILQLEQPDATMAVDSPLTGAVELDKNALLDFLRQVEADPGRRSALSLYVSVVPFVEPLVSLEARVTVARSQARVEPGAPSSVAQAAVDLPYRDLGEEPSVGSPAVLRHDYRGVGERLCVFDADGNAHVGFFDTPVIRFDGHRSFALAPLPIVTGSFCDTEAETPVDLNAVDLESVLELVESDLADLFEPATLVRFAMEDGLSPRAPELYELRDRLANLVANLAEPLLAAPCSQQIVDAARRSFSRAVMLDPSLDFADCAILAADTTCSLPKDSALTVSGVLGEGAGLPASLAAGDEAVGCVIRSNGSPIVLDGLSLRVRRLAQRDASGTRYFTPTHGSDGFDLIPFGATGSFKLPGSHRPAPPVLAAAAFAPATTSVSVAVDSRASDAMEWVLDGKRRQSPKASSLVETGISSMERYRRESPELVSDRSAEALGKLLDLMSGYLDGLETFIGTQAALQAGACDDAPDLSLRFKRASDGTVRGIEAEGDTERVLDIRYRFARFDDIPTTRSGASFAFDERLLPHVGEEVVLTVVLPNAHEHVPVAGCVRLAYRPLVVAGEKTNPRFDQLSSYLWF